VKLGINSSSAAYAQSPRQSRAANRYLDGGIKNIETPYPRMVQPNGEKISTFIKTDGLPPDVKSAVERVLNIVNSIHGVGEMPILPVSLLRGKDLGEYTHDRRRVEP
jgi:hypothetical protein